MAEHSPSQGSKKRRRRKKETEERSAVKASPAAGEVGREDVPKGEASRCDGLSQCGKPTDGARDEQAAPLASKKKKQQKPGPPSSEPVSDSAAGPHLSDSHRTSSELTSAGKLLPGGRGATTFEEELQWCVWQLELGTMRLDASKAQKQENERHMRTLNSPKAPLPRKRQLMRSLFGDYRSKMKHQPVPSVEKESKIVAVKRSTAAGSASYFRKAASHKSLSSANSSTQDDGAMTDAAFCFNFDIP